MSRTSRTARKRSKALVAGASVLAAATIAAPAAQAAPELILNYKCEYPLIGKRLLTVEITTNIPASWPKGVPTDIWDISAKSIAKEQTLTGLQLVSATSVEGSALAKSTVNVPAPAGGLVGLPVEVPITVPSTQAVGDAEGNLVLTATGQTPALTFPAAGAGNITVDGIQLNLIARKADGTAVTTFSAIQPGPPTDTNADTFDVYCELDPVTQSTKLKDIVVTEPEPDNVPPSAPGAGSASNVTTSGATLSWGAATDSDGTVEEYEITVAGQTLTSTDTTVDVTGLDADTAYTASVRAKDDDGDFGPATQIEFSTEAIVVPNVAPSAPGAGSASNETTSGATLSWGAATDSDGTVEEYEISVGGQTLTATGTSIDVTGLDADTAYTASVRAKDDDGEFGPAIQIAFSTEAVVVPNEAPSAPGAGEATDVTDISATVSWGAASDTDGTVTGYEVTVNDGAPQVIDGTSLDLTDLSPETAYSVSVRAQDDDGDFGPAITIEFTTNEALDFEQPSQPGAVEVTNITTTGASLSWGASSDNVGVTAYDIYNGIDKLGESTEPSFDVAGLSPNTEYTLQIVARDAAGNLSDERTVTFTTDEVVVENEAPSAPGAGSADEITQTSATLSWGAATDSDGTVEGYEVTIGGETTSVTGTSLDLTGLQAGTAYSASVVALDDDGATGPAITIEFTTLDEVEPENEAPSAPGAGSASAVTETSATVSWGAASDSDGEVTGYEVSVNGGAPSIVDGLSTDLTDLTEGTAYTVSVRAQDDDGAFGPAITVEFTTEEAEEPVNVAPTAPGKPAASEIKTTSVKLSWAASTDSDGTVAGYDVIAGGEVVASTTGATSVTVSGLTKNTEYSFTVVATDDDGAESEASAATAVKTLDDVVVPGDKPSITRVNGTGLAYIGGIAVIQGANFKDVKSVKIGSRSAGFLALSTKQIIAFAPAQKAGRYPVTVETKAGLSNENLLFTYKRLF